MDCKKKAVPILVDEPFASLGPSSHKCKRSLSSLCIKLPLRCSAPELSGQVMQQRLKYLHYFLEHVSVPNTNKIKPRSNTQHILAKVVNMSISSHVRFQCSKPYTRHWQSFVLSSPPHLSLPLCVFASSSYLMISSLHMYLPSPLCAALIFCYPCSLHVYIL